ncbi:MAG: hypothetical protein ACPF9K_14720 [Neptuniibacter sp.]
MKQRINLYRATKKTSSFDKNSLTGNAVIALAVVGVVLIAGLGVKLLDEENKADLASIKTEKRNIEARVQQLQDQFSLQAVSPDLQAEIKRISSQIDDRKNLMSLLDQIDPEQSLSFSSYLSALAESSRSESWLNEFSINTNDRSFQLVGGATDGPAVSSLLESIAKTTPFENMAVTALEVDSQDSGVKFQAEVELSVNE